VAGAVITECGHPALARGHRPARRACAPSQRTGDVSISLNMSRWRFRLCR